MNGTNLPGGTIKTVAGFGTALNARLNDPVAVAVDRWGNLFILDSSNHRIRKVDTNSMITTVAGGGTSGLGDGGAATNAYLRPSGIAVDGFGNLLIADTDNNRIRKVDSSGIISTIAGNGVPSYSGDGGAAVNAGLNAPMRVALDSIGNLFISDFANSVIRKVNTNGIITTVAGPGTSGSPGDGGPATAAELGGPYGICLDSRNNLFITEYLNSRIRRVDTNGIITTVAGTGTNGYSGDGGSATNAQVYYPFDLSVDAASRLLIADGVNDRVRRVDAGGVITTIAGGGSTQKLGDGGTATNASLSTVMGIALDSSGNLFIADSYNNRVRKVDTSGIINTVAGTGIPGFFGDDGAGVNGVLFYPSGIAFDKRGNLFIADQMSNRIREVFPNGQIVTVAGRPSPGYSGDGGPATNARLNNPYGVALDSSGNLFIADTLNARVRKVDSNGNISTFAGGGSGGLGDGGAATNSTLIFPTGLAVDNADNLFIADGLIRKVDTNGIITTVSTTGSSDPVYAFGLFADKAGNLLIADYDGNRIRKLDTNGAVTTLAGNGDFGHSGDGGLATNATMFYPTAVIVDSCGNVLIADHASSGRIRKVDTAGIITTLAGGGTDFAGDGGPATNAALICPWSLALDGAGNLLVADQGHNRIRQVQLYASYPTLSFLPLSLTDVGDYSVLITNFSGSVTSDVARLTVAVRPDIQLFSRGNGCLNFTWASVSNLAYQVQYSSDLTSANWLNLGAAVTASNASSSVSDLMGSDRQRFYRVLWVH